MPFGKWRPFCLGLNLLTRKPGQNGRPFTDDIFEYIFFKENDVIFVDFFLKFAPVYPISNKSVLIQVTKQFLND